MAYNYGSLQKAYSKAWRTLSPAEKSQFANYNARRLSYTGKAVKRQFDQDWQKQRRSNTADSRRNNDQPGPSRNNNEIIDFHTELNLDSLFRDDSC